MRTWYGNLAAAIRKSGLTQTQIAERLGLRQPTISNWLRGERTPNVEQIRRLGKVLGMSIQEMLGDEAVILENDDERELIAAYRKLSDADRETIERIILSLEPKEKPAED